MKASPTMKKVVQQLAEKYGLDLSRPASFLRLDMPGYDSLVIEVAGLSQIAVTHCFEECGEWQIEREVVLFTGLSEDWLPVEITQLATGWYAAAKLDAEGRHIVRVNHCDQERLADYTERWGHRIVKQNWMEQSECYQPWTPPWQKEYL